MKIVKLETFPVSVPYRHTERSSRVRRGGVSDVLVKLTGDNGLVGWGESCSGADTASIDAAICAMAPFVVGRSCWDVNDIAHRVYRSGLWDYRVQTGNFAFAGIDMALWDLCGKDCGRPLYQLFGGLQRQEVDYFYYLATADLESIEEQCRDGVARGYTCFYLKVGVDAASEEHMLEVIRSTIGPGGKIRIDANEAWLVAEAIQLLTRWHERFGIDFAEAPVPAVPLSLMQRVREHVPVSLCANEGLGSEQDVLRMLEGQVADVLCFSSIWVGTLRRFLTLSQLAHLQGVGVCKHTHGELGIAAAAAQHVMLTLANTVDGCQQTAAVMADDILTEEIPIVHGPRWAAKEAPGLGVEVDEAKLRHFNAAFERNGQFLPNE
jgi:L-alanine-DL-glutamate epimerase-like enolase superfamily enzyme